MGPQKMSQLTCGVLSYRVSLENLSIGNPCNCSVLRVFSQNKPQIGDKETSHAYILRDANAIVNPGMLTF